MKTKQKTLEEVFGEIKQSPWNKAAAEWKTKTQWIKNSQKVALELLEILDQRGLSQKMFAEKLQVSPQQVSKWLSGKENFTFETIGNFEHTLQVKLIRILDASSDAKPVESAFIPPFMEIYQTFKRNVERVEDSPKEAKVIDFKPAKYSEFQLAKGQ